LKLLFLIMTVLDTAIAAFRKKMPALIPGSGPGTGTMSIGAFG
jgi:hypothetical protein